MTNGFNPISVPFVEVTKIQRESISTHHNLSDSVAPAVHDKKFEFLLEALAPAV
jgi:hypothetical protein